MSKQDAVLPYISADELNTLLDFPSLVDALQSAHRQPEFVSDSLILNTNTQTDSANSFLSLPAWAPGKALGAKVVTVFPENPATFEGIPTVHALYPVFSGKTGQPLAVIDGTALTYWKTAADSALGSKLLARENSRHLAMLGAGDLSPWLVRAHVAIHPEIETVVIWNRTATKAQQVAAKLSEFDIQARAVEDVQEAVSSADIICAATAAQRPIIKGKWLKPGAHVDLVGSFTPQMRECDDETVRGAKVFMDSGVHALETGDLKDPIDTGILRQPDITDLYALCSGKAVGRTSDRETTLYKNGGGGHLDLMVAMHILRISGIGELEE